MPIAQVQFPDGRIGEFEVPDGTTQEQVLSFAQQNFQPKPQEKTVQYPDLSNTATKNGMAENLGRGYLQGGKNAIMGTLQAGADILSDQFPDNKTLQEARALLAEGQGRSKIMYQAQTGDSTAADIGEFAGEVAPFALLPAGGTSAASRVALGGAGGALAGATSPTTELQNPQEAVDQRQTGAVIGGAIGGAVPFAVGGAKPFMQKLFKINPTAARDFLDEGVQGSVATLTDRPALKQFASAISQYPGGVGVFDKATNKTLDDIQEAISRAGASKGVTTQEAGLVIKGGGEKYVDRFNEVAGKLYNRLDEFLPADSKVGVNNAVTQLQKELSGLPTNLAARRSGNEGVKVLQDIAQDGAEGLPYSALKQYRTIIGQKLSKSYLLGGEDEAVLKRAYGALTQDMEAAAAAKGQPALRAFQRANEFYKAGAENIEKNLQKVIQKDAPEQIYQAAISGTKLGGTKINSIMKSLAPEEREIVTGTVLKQLGGRGQDKFSTRTFLTEYNKLSPEAKKAIFRSQEGDISRIAKIAERLNSIDRFANPSGTGQRVGLGALIVTSLYDLGTGVGTMLGANATARLMNSPKFTKWLANAAVERATPKTLERQLGRLGQIAQKNPEIAQDIAKYVGVIGAVGTRGED